MGKIIKEIPGIPSWERKEWEKEKNAATAYTAEAHEPWKTVYIVVENAHDFYGERERGRYESFEEAEKALELYCNIYGGKIIETTWGELEIVTFV